MCEENKKSSQNSSKPCGAGSKHWLQLKPEEPRTRRAGGAGRERSAREDARGPFAVPARFQSAGSPAVAVGWPLVWVAADQGPRTLCRLQSEDDTSWDGLASASPGLPDTHKGCGSGPAPH